MAGTLAQALEQIRASEIRFYVYVLHRPNGEPFYVGKGTARRIEQHNWASAAKGSTIRARIIAKTRSEGLAIGYSVAGLFETEADAFAEERRLVAAHGRIDDGSGILANHTDGGEGACNPSAECIAKRSVKLKAAMADPARRAACVRRLKSNEEQRKENLAAALRTDEFRAKKSCEMREKWSDPTFRNSVSSASRAAQGDEWKKRHAAGVARIQADPLFHARRNAGVATARERINAFNRSPEARALKSVHAKAQRARQERARQFAMELAHEGQSNEALPDRRSSYATWVRVIERLSSPEYFTRVG